MAENPSKMWKKFIFLHLRRMFLYQYMLEGRLSRCTRCCFLSFSLNQLFYVQPGSSRLLVLSTRLLFCRGVSSLRSNACLSYEFWFVLTFCALFLVFLVISMTCGVGSAFVTRYITWLYTRALSLKQTTTRHQVNERLLPQNESFAISKMDAKRKKYIYC